MKSPLVAPPFARSTLAILVPLLHVSTHATCRAQEQPYGIEPTQTVPKQAKPFAREFFRGRDKLTRFGMAISADASECYYAVALRDNGYFREEIRVTRREASGTWTDPRPLLPQEKKYKYVDPHLSPDDRRLYFIYTRPADEKNAPRRQAFDICFVEREERGWGDPIRVPAPISTGGFDEYFVSLTADKTLFFGSNRDDRDNFDLYCARLGKTGRYERPVRLPGKVNTKRYEADVFVAPDESYVIFSSSGRKEGRGNGDLYVSFKAPSGEWGPGKNLGDRVNSKQQEFAPSISRDRKALLFSRGGVIHWVSTAVIDDLKR